MTSPVILACATLALSNCAQRISVREAPLASLGDSIAGTSVIEESRKACDTLKRSNSSGEAVAPYNKAVTRVMGKVASSFPLSTPGDHRLVISDQGLDYSLELKTGPGVSWDLSEIQSLRAAEFLKIRGLRERIETDGVGTPLVAKIAPSPERRFTAASGFYLPATAILDFSSERTGTLTFFDPIQTPSTTAFGPARPLRADFTAPIATTYAMRDRQRINLPAMILFDKFQNVHGMRQLGSIDPGKIPVVFVHGLKSNPDTWRNPINELMNDPVVRERFEFWNFGYATGPPIPFSAMQLRESLREMAEHRTSLGAPTDDVVLIGHSMGGLMSGLMTQSSGDENWFKLFEKPLDELDLPESDRDLLRRMAYYDPLPFVNRVVFISTPHGGTEFASNAISRLASGLIQIPGSLLTLSADLLRSPDYALTPIGQKVVQEVPTSIDTLRSDSELVRLFRAMPSNPDVFYHSIIGTEDPIVPYESLRFEDAVSEKRVPAGHEAHLHPESIEELRRILREHVGL